MLIDLFLFINFIIFISTFVYILVDDHKRYKELETEGRVQARLKELRLAKQANNIKLN